MWVPVTSNRCPDHLSRQILTTASTFPYSSKNSSAEHIYDLSTWLIITNTLTHSHRKKTHTLMRAHTHTHTHTLNPQPNIFLLYQHGSPSQSNSLTQTNTHTHKQTHTHILTHTHTHTHTHTLTHTDSLTLTQTGICIRKPQYVRLRNFQSCMERQRRWSRIVC